MKRLVILEGNYSTTRLLSQWKPEIVNEPDDKVKTMLFLPPHPERKGEGGLRTKGYFKYSYEIENGHWYACDFRGQRLFEVESPKGFNLDLEKFKCKDKVIRLPLVSVVTVVLNGKKYLEDAIQSVLDQIYPNVEYVIIDGGSTDGTVDIIRKYENCIDYWVSESDRGIYDALNKGLSLVTGKIIGLLNADDLYHISSLFKVINTFLKKEIEIAIYYGIAKYVIDNVVIKSVEKKFNKKRILRGFGFLHTTCFVPIKVYQKIGYFDINYKIAGDTDFLLRCYISGTKFIKNNHITYMRLGGVSDKQIINGNKEYLQQLNKYKLADKKRLKIYRLLFISSLPFLKLRHSYRLRKFLLQIKFILVSFINLTYNFLPIFYLKRIFLKTINIKIGKSSYIHPKVKFFNWGNIKIGQNTVINSGCYLDNRREISIGNNVSIAHDCKIYTLGHDVDSPFFETKGKSVKIEDNVVIFSNVLIMPGVTIKKGAVILPGSIVTKDVDSYSVMGGNPARCIRKRYKKFLYKIDYGYWKAL